MVWHISKISITHALLLLLPDDDDHGDDGYERRRRPRDECMIMMGTAGRVRNIYFPDSKTFKFCQSSPQMEQ